jgi:aminoglycoside phosphotransferase (APT) family kinase protein
MRRTVPPAEAVVDARLARRLLRAQHPDLAGLPLRRIGAGTGPPSWLHGDLHGLNVLVDRGRVSGVIDFGDMCAGDPATDVAVAWLVLDRDARALFRRRAAVDDPTWRRARGWALFFGLMFAQHSVDAPVNASIGRRVLQQVLVDD